MLKVTGKSGLVYNFFRKHDGTPCMSYRIGFNKTITKVVDEVVYERASQHIHTLSTSNSTSN